MAAPRATTATLSILSTATRGAGMGAGSRAAASPEPSVHHGQAGASGEPHGERAVSVATYGGRRA
eukprot:977616-Pyramimonas_sp.AAC.1